MRSLSYKQSAVNKTYPRTNLVAIQSMLPIPEWDRSPTVLPKAIRLMLILIGLFFCRHLASAQPVPDSLWIRSNYQKREVYIPMRDGTRLFTAIYLPNDRTETHPILLARTPYSCAPYGENNFLPGLWTHHLRYYAREHYVLVYQDVRGRYKSEGVFEDIRPLDPSRKSNHDTDESTDAYDTIDWLVRNLDNNNGRVGVFGVSYPGFYATMAALSGHPALKAASPQAPVTDWYKGDDVHHNGALFLSDAFSFFIRAGMGYPRNQKQSGQPALPDTPTDSYHFFLKLGSLAAIGKLSGDSSKIWNDIYAHPDYDHWWQGRSVTRFAGRIRIPMLVVGGLFDAQNLYGTLALYKALNAKASRLVLGPWYHGQWSSSSGGRSLGGIDFGSPTGFWYQDSLEIPFFNHYLKGKGDLSAQPPATVFFTGENAWRQFDRWPVARTRQTRLYFQANGKLCFDAPATAGAYTSYVSDPANPVPYSRQRPASPQKEYMIEDQRFLAGRMDVLSFATGPLQEDITVAGGIGVNLHVSLSTTDADFVVKLIDVFPGNGPAKGLADSEKLSGYQMLVRGDLMRGRYRKSFEKPVPFVPGNTDTVGFALPDIAHTFKKGHRIMVQVQSSWFPLVDRNPQRFVNIYTCTDQAFVRSVIHLWHASRHQSYISLPVLAD